MASKLNLNMRIDGYVKGEDIMRLNMKTFANVPLSLHTFDDIKEVSSKYLLISYRVIHKQARTHKHIHILSRYMLSPLFYSVVLYDFTTLCCRLPKSFSWPFLSFLHFSPSSPNAHEG